MEDDFHFVSSDVIIVTSSLTCLMHQVMNSQYNIPTKNQYLSCQDTLKGKVNELFTAVRLKTGNI